MERCNLAQPRSTGDHHQDDMPPFAVGRSPFAVGGCRSRFAPHTRTKARQTWSAAISPNPGRPATTTRTTCRGSPLAAGGLSFVPAMASLAARLSPACHALVDTGGQYPASHGGVQSRPTPVDKRPPPGQPSPLRRSTFDVRRYPQLPQAHPPPPQQPPPAGISSIISPPPLLAMANVEIVRSALCPLAHLVATDACDMGRRSSNLFRQVGQ